MSSVRSIIKSTYAVGDISAGALVSGNMGADISGPITTIDKIDSVAYQVSWTSSNAVGIISVQGSCDGINFEDITFSPVLEQPASNNGSYLINMSLIPFSFIRIYYDRTSGTGSLSVHLSAKGW